MNVSRATTIVVYMKKSLRKGKTPQAQKSITPFTVGSTKMADNVEVTLSLQTLREELAHNIVVGGIGRN